MAFADCIAYLYNKQFTSDKAALIYSFSIPTLLARESFLRTMAIVIYLKRSARGSARISTSP